MAGAKYGLPYLGSKSAIADWVVEHLPRAGTLVDLFCGGCAVTHAAMLSGKWEHFIANDIHGDVPKLFLDAIAGKYTTQSCRDWVSRETFRKTKDMDAYVRLGWSFGNAGKSYMYAEEIEPFKHRIHDLIFADTIDERVAAWKAFIGEYDRLNTDIERLGADARKLCADTGAEMIVNGDGSINAEKTKANVMRVLSADIREYLRDALKKSGHTVADVDKLLGTNGMAGHYFGASQWALPTAEAYAKMRTIMPDLTVPWAELNESLQRLQRLQSLQRLQRLQSLQSLQRLETSGKDYREVEIPPDSVVYCDIPYDCTEDNYGTTFDRQAFFDWACAQTVPVIVSEYNIAADRFEVLAETSKLQLLAGAAHAKNIQERLYAPKHQIAEIRRRLDAEKDEQIRLEV